MASRRMGVAALVPALMLLAAPVVAQDGSEASAARTPENAQRFLSVATEQYPISMTPKTYFASYDWELSYKPIRAASVDRCVTRFEGEVSRFYAKDASGQLVGGHADADPAKNAEWFRASPEIVERLKLKTAPYEVDWSKVTHLAPAQNAMAGYDQVKKAYPEIDGSIAIIAGDTSFALYAPSAELGGRMLLAMQTLKQACDKTAELGF